MAYLLLIPVLPQPVVEVTRLASTVQAAEDNFIYYRDIIFEAGRGGHANQDDKVVIDFPALKVTNLKFNKTTKRMTYDIIPGSNLHVTYTTGRPDWGGYTEPMKIEMCSTVYTKAAYQYELNRNAYGDDNLWTCNDPRTPDYYGQYYNWSADWGMLHANAVASQGYYMPAVLDVDMSKIRELMANTYPNEYAQGYNYYQPSDYTPGLDKDPEMFRIRVLAWTKTYWWSPYMTRVAQLIPNYAPSLSVGTANGITLVNAPGLSGINIEGYVSDPDNEDVTVTAEIPGVFYKKTVVPQAKLSKPFNIPLDVLQDSIPPGTYTVNITASDPSGMTAKAALTINVKQQMRNKSFVLVNTPVETRTKFFDSEWDPKREERYRFDHDPYFLIIRWGSFGILDYGEVHPIRPSRIAVPTWPRSRVATIPRMTTGSMCTGNGAGITCLR